MNTHELAWAAGFFDGEGTTSIARTLTISIAQVNRSNLERFQKAVGNMGNISQAYHRGKKPIYVFRCHGDVAFSCMRLLCPHLGTEKQEQFVRAAIRYCFRTVRNRAGNPYCRRGHATAIVGRYKDNDCNECRRLRKSNQPLPPMLPSPTAFDLRLHGIREYVPPTMRTPARAKSHRAVKGDI